MTTTKTKEKKSYKFVDQPLNYLISCRVRLREEQRQLLKDTYNALRFGKQETQEPVLQGSGISSVTYTDAATRLYQETGMSAVVIGDLIGSRETISLPVILKLQRALGCECVTKDDIEEAMKGYAEYVFSVMPL